MLLLSTSYFPSVNYFSEFLCYENVQIESQEHFIKQTHRNRCSIATPQGVLHLSIPLINEGNKTITAEKKISYTENWQIKHWRAIESAYNKSAYFEYFEQKIKEALFAHHEKLIDLNHQLMLCLLNILRIEKTVHYTTSFQKEGNFTDHRDEKKCRQINSSYYQVFKHKTGFLSNLSVLDLIFNEGLHAKEFLYQNL